MTMARWANNRCYDADTCVGDPDCPSFVGSQACQNQATQSQLREQVKAWAAEIDNNCTHLGDPNIAIADEMRKYVEALNNGA